MKRYYLKLYYTYTWYLFFIFPIRREEYDYVIIYNNWQRVIDNTFRDNYHYAEIFNEKKELIHSFSLPYSQIPEDTQMPTTH